MTNQYLIARRSDLRRLGLVAAENAIAALSDFCAGLPDDDLGYQRGGLQVDADTRGQRWASVRTDGGRIIAAILEEEVAR
jgi:hypothetical protein